MNLLQRMKVTVEATLHEVFDKAENKNPIALLNHYVRQAEKETLKVGELVVRQGELKVKVEKELQEVTNQLAKRKEQAELAAIHGEEDLIAFTQAEIMSYTNRQTLLTASLAEVTEGYISLEQQFEQMKHRLEDMKVRQLHLMSKENMAHANYRMQEIEAKQVDMHSNQFDEAVQHIDRIAMNVNQKYTVTTFEHRLAALEKKE